MTISIISRTLTMALTALAFVTLPLAAPAALARGPEPGEKWSELKVLSKGFAARRREPAKVDAGAKQRRLVAKKLKQVGRRDELQSAVAADGGNALWLRTRGEGLFGMTLGALSEALGMPPEYLRQLARRGDKLALTKGPEADSVSADQPVAWYYDAAGDALLFVGESHETFHTDENAYRLWFNPKKSHVMRLEKGKPPRGQGDYTYFLDTLTFEREPDYFYSLWTVKDQPDADYWFWDYLYGGYKDAIEVNLSLPAPAVTGTGQLRVLLRGWTDLEPGDEHHVYAELNGHAIGGTVDWDGFEAVTLTADFDQAILDPAGNNILGLFNEYTPGEHPGQWLDAVEVDYWRAPVAINDQLRLHDLEKGTYTVGGFSGDDILVIQLPPAGMPVLLQNVRIDGDLTEGWSVTFKTDKTPGDYLVVNRDVVQTVTMEIDVPSNLAGSGNGADYLIIAPRELEGTAGALAAHRRDQSGLVEIAWLDDIYGEFNAGREDPAAITRFMEHVSNQWQSSPYFVTLLGKGSIDHKDRMGYADSYLPLSMTTTPWALTASDDRLLGGNGDAPFAIGRIPVTGDEEGLGYVEKVIAYETGGVSNNTFKALLVADNPDIAGDFHANSDILTEKLLSEADFEQVTGLYHPRDAVRERLITPDAWEVGYVGYDGHGTAAQIGDFREKFITAADAALLQNTTRPVFTALTCAVGDDTQPGTRSLAGALVLNPFGGAIASFAPTGLSLDADAQYLGNAFIDHLYAEGRTIGGAVHQAKIQTDGYINDFMNRVYSVIGDPAVYAR